MRPFTAGGHSTRRDRSRLSDRIGGRLASTARASRRLRPPAHGRRPHHPVCSCHHAPRGGRTNSVVRVMLIMYVRCTSDLGHGYWCDFPKTTSTTWRAPGRAVPPLHRGRGGQVLRLAPRRAVVNAVQKVAATRGVSMAQVALAWVLRHPAVTAPIIGATKPQQPSEAVAALGLHLTDDEIHALQEPYTPHGPSWF